MLNYSFSTVLMAFLASNLLLVFITLCFCNAKIMANAGYKLLALFILFTILRFILPFELPFCTTLYMPRWLSSLVASIRHRDTGIILMNHMVSLWNIFELIWGIGILILLLRYIIRYLKTTHEIILYRKDVTRQTPYLSLLQQICDEKGKPNRFRVYTLPIVKTPRLYGILHPWILLPEGQNYTETELYYILSHEAAHHFHHDLLTKTIIKIITIFYWWNPFCPLLNKQASMILEMHVDDSLVASDSRIAKDYMRTLIALSERLAEDHSIPQIYTMSLFPEKTGATEKRFNMMTADASKRNKLLNITFSLITVFVLVFSYSFIFEAVYVVPEASDPLFEGVSEYALDNGDGTYNIYLGSVHMKTVNSLANYPYAVVIHDISELPDEVLIIPTQ